MSISTKEQLKDHSHAIHNLIRNAGCAYGLDGFKIFNFFYGLKVLEPYWKQFKLKSMKFSNMVKLSKKTFSDESNCELLIEIFGNHDIKNKTDPDYKLGCLYELNNHNELKKIIVTKINQELKTNFYKQLIIEIDKIPTISTKQKSDIVNDKFDVDIKGKTYEYFIGRDKQAISDLGSYFTDRHITNFILNTVKPKLIDGKIPSYIDPFGGSGGFTLAFVSYIKNKFSEIDWDENIDSINHFDMSEVVVKSCALELLAITGKIPDMTTSFQIGNTFKNEFGTKKKYHYICSNPPFGGSVSINTNSESFKLIDELKRLYYTKVKGDNEKEVWKWTKDWAESQYHELKQKQKEEIANVESQQVNWETCSKRIRDFCTKYDEKISKKYYSDENSKELIKNFQIKEKCNDKEACSLVMFMELLDKNGTAAIVLKEGVLFDAKYSAIRKCLVDNFCISHIISIPQDAFENTTTKTSVVIFENSNQTKKIRFSELVVEKEIEDVFEEVTNENNETRLELTLHKDQITKVHDQVKTFSTFEQISTPILKVLSKSKSKQVWNYSLNWKDYLKDETTCPEGYELVKMKDIFDYKPKSKRPASFASNDGSYRFYTSSDTIKKCIECDFKSDKQLLIFGTGGKGSLFIDKEFSCSADNFVCSLKKDYSKEYINYIYQYIKSNWKYFLFKMFNGSTLGHINQSRLNDFQIPIPSDISKLKLQLKSLSKLHSTISDLSEQIPQKEKEICEEIKRLTEEGKEGVDWDEFKLGDICEVLAGKYLKSYQKGTKFPIIGGGDISGYIDIYNNENDWVIHKDGVSKKIISYIKGKFLLNHHGWIMKMKTNVSKNYIGFSILNKTNEIMDNLNGSNQKGLNQDKFYSFKIRVPKDKIFTKYKLQEKFDEIDKLKEELELTKTKYQEEIKILMEPFGNNDDDEKLSDDDQSANSAKSDKSTKSNKSNQLDLPEELVDIPKVSKSTKSTKSTKSKTNKIIDKKEESDSNSDFYSNHNQTQTKTKTN
jgi:type I restriction-modification system DNA methylase subunit